VAAILDDLGDRPYAGEVSGARVRRRVLGGRLQALGGFGRRGRQWQHHSRPMLQGPRVTSRWALRSDKRVLMPIRIRRHDKLVIRPKSLRLRELPRAFQVDQRCVLCGQENQVLHLIRISLIIVRPTERRLIHSKPGDKCHVAVPQSTSP